MFSAVAGLFGNEDIAIGGNGQHDIMSFRNGHFSRLNRPNGDSPFLRPIQTVERMGSERNCILTQFKHHQLILLEFPTSTESTRLSTKGNLLTKFSTPVQPSGSSNMTNLSRKLLTQVLTKSGVVSRGQQFGDENKKYVNLIFFVYLGSIKVPFTFTTTPPSI